MGARIAAGQAPAGQIEASGTGDQDNTTPHGEPGIKGGTPPPDRPAGKHLSIGLWASLWDPEAHRRAQPTRHGAQTVGGGAEGSTAAPESAVAEVVAEHRPPATGTARR